MFTTRFIAARAPERSPVRGQGARRPGIRPKQLRIDALRWGAVNLNAALLITDFIVPLMLGIACALAAWSPGFSPAVGLLFPMLWIMSASRRAAFTLAAAYVMTVVRFLPDFAGNWFASPVLGLACWIGVGMASGALWGLLWPVKSDALHVTGATMAALLLSLMPPMGALFPGHAVACWGFALPGSGWIGVAALSLGTATAAAALRFAVAFPHGTGYAWLVLAAAAIALAVFGTTPEPEGGRRAGNVLGVSTAWGGFPQYGSIEVAERLRRIGVTLDARAAEGPLTLIYPEAILGLYDTSLDDVIELEIGRRIRSTGQTVVLGADINAGGGHFRNIALVLRPDGSRSIISARQTTPLAQWRPWSSEMHFPANWLSSTTVNIGGNPSARIMFCHEEWMSALHMVSEAREGHPVVIAMANLWAAEDPLANYIQSAHTQGMVLLFGRRFVRAVNLAAAPRP